MRLPRVAGENAAEQRLQECCIAQVRAEQVGPTQLGPKQGRIAQVRLAQISAAQISPEQGGSAQVGAKQVCLAQIRLEQVGVAEIYFAQISPAQAGSDQRWPALWVSPAPLVPSLTPCLSRATWSPSAIRLSACWAASFLNSQARADDGANMKDKWQNYDEPPIRCCKFKV